MILKPSPADDDESKGDNPGVLLVGDRMLTTYKFYVCDRFVTTGSNADDIKSIGYVLRPNSPLHSK